MISKMIRFLVMISSSLCMLTACVTVQTSPAVTKNSHIAIISAVGSNAIYKSIATTVFQNSENQIPLRNFDVDSSIALIAKQNLNNLGYQNVTIINTYPNNILTMKDIYDTGFSTVSFKPAASQYMQALIQNKNIDYILFLTKGGACPPTLDCDTDAVYGYGVFERTFLNIGSAFTYAALTADILDAKTLNNLETESDSSFDNSQSTLLKDSFNAPTPSALNYLKGWVGQSYRNLTTSVIQKTKMLTSSAAYNKVTF